MSKRGKKNRVQSVIEVFKHALYDAEEQKHLAKRANSEHKKKRYSRKAKHKKGSNRYDSSLSY